MVDNHDAKVVVYGREEKGALVNDKHAFHACVECEGWLIDFMSPTIGVALNVELPRLKVLRLMLQRPLSEGKGSIGGIKQAGDFFISHDATLTNSLLDNQPAQFEDLVSACLVWYCKPPKRMKDMVLADRRGVSKKLIARPPSVNGAW